ncbi:uncharacterized protein MONBRDRAFT_34752 [Monosiga brevicollis MX1]|uniref:GST C-terminal domain-containing protein n=1 Tax=Monosiga brevicollis TaxID=81824 RepID=A9VDT4_MONBE|nr:uncharacterized protein MONBRDRAFT_34752 [Monosiga brevicollis MX1]EDQ84315.1 predicted protein [Monosiga brevicollis MX1]|eukprot:XP_001750885.1 hypothetical protein [Monosiga brevicollis MX1]
MFGAHLQRLWRSSVPVSKRLLTASRTAHTGVTSKPFARATSTHRFGSAVLPQSRLLTMAANKDNVGASQGDIFGTTASDQFAHVEGSDQNKFGVSEEEAKAGAFRRPPTAFHDTIGSEKYPAEAGRYHLYVAWACPWAHRALLMRSLKGLEDVISVTMLGWFLEWPDDGRPYRGWPFTKEDPDPLHPEFEYLHDVYNLAQPGYPYKKLSVPVLFDKKTQTIVNNESSEIIRMFNSQFNDLAKRPELDLEPADLESAMTEIDELVYPNINDGVYRCGFAGSQEAYDTACTKLFDALDKVEALLGKQRYLCGDRLTLSDIRLVTTLLRFDIVYHTHFKCNKRRVVDYPNLWGYTREIYQMEGVSATFNPLETKKHYFGSHRKINPLGIVAQGPDNYEALLSEPHGRDRAYN